MKQEAKRRKIRIVGREEEQGILTQLLSSDKAEFVAVYGRRRVGKTFLIQSFFQNNPCVLFHATGIKDGALEDQLGQFYEQMGLTFYRGAALEVGSSWMKAFRDLGRAIENLKATDKVVLFLDELPWMATKRSRLLQALEFYWNRHWSTDPRVKLIICGSSASWVIEKIIANKGGLYNRVTKTLRLSPFSLLETKEFLDHLGVRLGLRHILELYLVMGGIPHYLAKLKDLGPKLSAQQYINELCFKKKGDLVHEFEPLFASLFKSPKEYIRLIRAIAKCRYGMSQGKLLGNKGSDGGRTVQKLKHLEEAGFIASFVPHGHQEKGTYLKVVDEYTLFYLYWIEPHLSTIRAQGSDSTFWLAKARSPAWKSWSGLAFEAVCYKHIPQIRKALGISTDAEVGSWRYAPRLEKVKTGAQIDLLFDRPDQIITVCEIKHSDKPFVIDKECAEALKQKMAIYKQVTRSRKELYVALVTSAGVKTSQYSKELQPQTTDLGDLFAF